MAQTQTFVLVGISLTMESRYWLVPANQKYIFYFHASADKRNQLRNSLKFGNIESYQVFLSIEDRQWIKKLSQFKRLERDWVMRSLFENKTKQINVRSQRVIKKL